MRGDLLTKTRKLVKGLAKPAPTWLKAMEESVLHSSHLHSLRRCAFLLFDFSSCSYHG
jgi:hypothetical protein